MRLIYGFLLSLLFVTGPAFGQQLTVTVDNSSMDSADIAEVTLTPAGELIITSKDNNYEFRKVEVSPGSVLINSFTINYKTSEEIASGVEATLRWSTTNATLGCSASVESGPSVDAWNSGTDILAQGPATVVFTSGGVYNLRLDCDGDNSSTDHAIVTVIVNGAKITRFDVTPTSVDKGSDVTLKLTWDSENTQGVGCSGSSNWPNSIGLASSGTDDVVISNIQADTSFTLKCYSGFDTVESTVTVNVTEPQLACNTTLTSKVEKRWTEVFREAFPGPRSDEVRVTVPIRGYYSVEFNTGNAQDTGFFGNIEASGTFGYRLGAISKCPGDFDVPEECSHAWGGDNGGIIWTTQGLDNRCELEPNTTYYWNLTFTDGSDPESSRCLGSYCETYFTVSNR